MTKEKLIDAIKEITDQSILDDIQRLLQIELEDEVFKTADDQRSRIERARKDVDDGNVIDFQLADKEIDEWLNE